MQINHGFKWVLMAVLVCALPATTLAGNSGTLYTELGSNGVGLGYALSVSDNWAVRGQYNSYDHSFSGDVGDYGAAATMQLDLSLSSVEVLGDWYPGRGGFRLSGGVVFNNNKVTVTGTGANVGGATNQTVVGEIKMSKSPSPYLGLGYSSRPKEAKGFGFTFDFGVMGQDPEMSLTSTGATPALQSQVNAQIAANQSALDKLRTMPVLGLGLSYTF